MRGTKLVLVSAVTFVFPGILERSCIGAKDVLECVGVKQRVDSGLELAKNTNGTAIADVLFLTSVRVQVTISCRLRTFM